jgi:hypothetical protein
LIDDSWLRHTHAPSDEHGQFCHRRPWRLGAWLLAQQDKSAWTREDVIKYLGRVLPRSGKDPDWTWAAAKSELLCSLCGFETQQPMPS